MLESPIKSSKNSFLDRYVSNLGSEDSVVLKPLSPNKINSSSNVAAAYESNNKEPLIDKSNIFLRNLNSSKENIFSSSPSHTPLKVTSKPGSSFDVDNNSLNAEQLRYNDFLCRVEEVRQWIEAVIGETLPSSIELCTGDSLRNGVVLATVAQKINPDLVKSIFPASNKLQFKHTQNINEFFSLVDHVGVPDSFRFELQDLYNKKDLPQVFETLNILISIINKKWPSETPQLQNLTNIARFSKEDIRKCQRCWPKIRDFKSLAISPTTSSKKTLNKKSRTGLINDFDQYGSPTKYEYKSIQTPQKKENKLSYEYKTPTLEYKSLVDKVDSPINDQNVESTYSDYRSLYSSQTKDLSERIPHIQYSPIKLSSLLYHSPSISRYNSVNSEFFLRRSQYREQNLQFYQTYAYSPSRYSPGKRNAMSEEEFLEKLIDIQSVVRGVNTRFSLGLTIRLAKLYEQEIIKIQSNIRGHLLRSGFKETNNIKIAPRNSEYIIGLQSFMKGELIRGKFDRLRIKCLRNESSISLLQRLSKGASIRKTVQSHLLTVKLTNQPLSFLQAYIRGNKTRSNLSTLKSIEIHCDGSIIKLQSILRAKSLRQDMNTKKIQLYSSNLITLLQASVKGYLRRRHVTSVLQDVQFEHKHTDKLIGIIRGNLVRSKTMQYINNIASYKDSVNSLQGYIRGILVRYALDLVDDVIERNNIVQLQGKIKGGLIRTRLASRLTYFSANTKQIVRIQSWIRMHHQKSAYIDLMGSPNPTLWSVKKFVHLLNDIPSIEKIQNQLESNQAALDSTNMMKEKLEKDMRQQMDFAQVLDRYKIDSTVIGKLSNIHVPNSKYGSFEKLFYLLQIEPSYWKYMYNWEPKFAKSNNYVVFSTVNQRMGQRERVYYMKLIVEIAQQNLLSCSSIKQFLEQKDLPWQQMLSEFLKREYPELIRLFIPVLDFIKDQQIDFTSNPIDIYKRLHLSDPPTDSFAIEDADTSKAFIMNLRNIWHAVEMVAEIFSSNGEEIPHEIKYLCTKFYLLGADMDADGYDVLCMISKVLINTFCAEYLNNFDYFGFGAGSQYQLNEKVGILNDSVSTVFSFISFSGFYEPLNQYLNEIKPFLQTLLKSMMLDESYMSEYDRLIYEDMLSSRPTLEILAEKIFIICQKFQEYSKFLPNNDPLVDILKQCREEMNGLGSGRLVLELNSSSYRFLNNDDKMKGIYEQVKRALIYMMQIEEVDTNLYDLAISTILPKDEPVFHDFIVSHQSVYSDDIVLDLKSPKYFNLKNFALTLINELENNEILNCSENHLQDVLNDIATTIKEPTRKVKAINNKIEITKITLSQLIEFNIEMEHEIRSIKSNIKAILDQFCASKNFVSTNKGTFNSIKDAYSKSHSKSNAGLKFKWTTRQLYEAGVLKKIDGEKLGELSVKVFGSSGPKFPDINFKISTSNGKTFNIKISDKRKNRSKMYHHLVDTFDFFDLLNTQVGKKVAQWYLFDSKITFETSGLLELIATNFYN